jgi:hypothetical protein
MRLSDKEKKVIVQCVLALDPKAQIYLFGSRTDDTKKGGDIDLFIMSENLNLDKKLNILSAIQKEIGEQKIDILIRTFANTPSDPFVQSFLPKAILLSTGDETHMPMGEDPPPLHWDWG